MGKFQTADVNGKIQLIKDSFNELIGQISNEPDKIRDILKLGEKPKPVAAIHTPLHGNESEERRKEIEGINALADTRATEETARLEQEYASKIEAVNNIGEAIKKMGKKEGCICGTCFNTEATNGSLSPDFEPLIDIARTIAENS